MTTQLAFAFGMLTMVAITMLVAIVVGMVKVIRLENHSKELERALGREIEQSHRLLSEAERMVYSEITEVRRQVDEHMDRLRHEYMSYTDSRIDKAMTTKEKQLLKS